ncbi:MAG: hypothetical protein HYZ11_00840 [Candidatus Tectomicrobia bacterium]|uniref:Uncharacterized protein n=1 Tax=Tectimicrobiota bacterium TaxID=2528274 RepID=A0A932MLZ9_UNCTE|nr:hypothetical protein [Candidatus Tectomicrobia bacterium]
MERALDTVPGVEKTGGDPRTKRLEVRVREGAAGETEEEVVRLMKQIGYPVER